MFTKYHQIGRALGVAAGPGSVIFSLKTMKEEKVFLFPLKMLPTFNWYLTQGFKTKRSLRFYVDRDRQNRSIDKITTVTLWCMRAEGLLL